MRLLAILVLASLPACWPGRCEGGLRALLPLPSKDETVAELGREPANLSINLDTNLGTGAEVLAASQLSARTVLLEGPAGLVPLTVEASVNPSAHSCASRGSVRATSTEKLGPGDYTFVVLIDQIRWPAIDGSDVTTWQGHRAMTRRYHVP